MLETLKDDCTKLHVIPAEPRRDICLMGASFDTGNLGVSALAASAYKCILHAFAEPDVFLLDYAKQPSVCTCDVDGKKFYIPVVNIRFSKKFYLRNNIALLLGWAVLMRLLPFASLRRWLLGRNDVLRRLDKVSLGAAVSGGDSFSDIYGVRRFLYVTLPPILLLTLGKKLVLLPQTIGPFKSRFARFVANAMIRRSAVVYSRDRSGFETLAEQYKHDRRKPDVRFCYDMAFTLDAKSPAVIRVVGFSLDQMSSAPLVGVNISGLLFAGGYTGKNMFQVACSYRELICKIVEHCIAERKARVLLVPHVFGAHAGIEDDRAASKQVFEELAQRFPGRIGHLEGDYNQSEVKYVIGQCDFFIGSRMHACIAAVSQSVPALSLAYSDKFKGVMGAIGIDDMVADLRLSTESQIIEQLNRGLDKRLQVREQLRAVMPEVQETVLGVLRGL